MTWYKVSCRKFRRTDSVLGNIYYLYETEDSHTKIHFTCEIFILYVELKHFHIGSTTFICETARGIFIRVTMFLGEAHLDLLKVNLLPYHLRVFINLTTSIQIVRKDYVWVIVVQYGISAMVIIGRSLVLLLEIPNIYLLSWIRRGLQGNGRKSKRLIIQHKVPILSLFLLYFIVPLHVE